MSKRRMRQEGLLELVCILDVLASAKVHDVLAGPKTSET